MIRLKSKRWLWLSFLALLALLPLQQTLRLWQTNVGRVDESQRYAFVTFSHPNDYFRFDHDSRYSVYIKESIFRVALSKDDPAVFEIFEATGDYSFDPMDYTCVTSYAKKWCYTASPSPDLIANIQILPGPFTTTDAQ